MKRNVLIAPLLFMAFLQTPTNTFAQTGDITFTRHTGKGVTATWGTNKSDTYDVAIMLTGKDLRGKTVKSVTIPFASKKELSDLKVWLTHKLTLEKDAETGKKINQPDILSQDAEITADTTTVDLTNPYTIDADTIYIGYTVTSTVPTGSSDGKQPIIITTEKANGGLLVHTNKTYLNWKDLSATKGSVALSATLAGASANSVTATIPTNFITTTSKAVDATLTLTNYGYKGVQSVDYSFIINGNEVTGTAVLDQAIPAIYGAKGTVDIEIPKVTNKGVYPVQLSITGVNDGDNALAQSIETTIEAYNYFPRHRAVLEEYTGTWCGYCPRGFVGLEVMNRLYPDDFIGISYHNDDPMSIFEKSADYPSAVSSFPAAWLDRSYKTDAYNGFQEKGFGVDEAWKAACNIFAPLAIETKAKISKNGKKIYAEATSNFIKDIPNANYKMEFILVSDSLTGTSSLWNQSNYYADASKGGAETYPEPEFKKFYAGAESVTGLEYPDVIIYTTRAHGEDVPMPTNIHEDDEIKTSFEFDLDKVVNIEGTPLIQKKSALRVVTLVIDEDGKIVNAAKAPVSIDEYTAGINNSITATTNNVSTAIYSLSGKQSNEMQKGINIIKTQGKSAMKILKR